MNLPPLGKNSSQSFLASSLRESPCDFRNLVILHLSQPIPLLAWGDFFECCFEQSSKLKARTSLLPVFSEKRRSSFKFEHGALKQLSKMSLQMELAVQSHCPRGLQYPKQSERRVTGSRLLPGFYTSTQDHCNNNLLYSRVLVMVGFWFVMPQHS